jgi:hypothetical protein
MFWRRLDNYRKAMLIMLPFALILLLYMLISNPLDLLYADWFADILIVPTFFGTLISSAGYAGRVMDALSPKPVAGLSERIGTCLGFIVGLSISITLLFLKKTIPFVSTLHYLASAVFTMGNLAAFSGLGNRIGSFVDHNARPVCEKRSIATVALLGFAAGLALFFTHQAAVVCITGVATFFTGGVALPFILCGIIFATSFSGLCASNTDYFTKAGSFLRSKVTHDPIIKNNVKEKFHEYRGACAGVGTGLIVAAVIITALALSQPYIFAGIVGLAMATVVIMACVSVIGGLCSRVGRVMDSRIKIKRDQEIELMPIAPKKKLTSEIQYDASAEIVLIKKNTPATEDKPAMILSDSHSAADLATSEARDKCSVKTLIKSLSKVNLSNSIPVSAPVNDFTKSLAI